MTSARFGPGYLACLGLVVAISSTAKADWYGGDPTLTTPVPTAAFYYAPSGNTHLALENFTWTAGVGAGIVDKVGGNYFSYAPGNIPGNITEAYWEIRSGASVGNGGTLVASGLVTPTISPTAFTVAGEPVTRVTADIPNFLLANGNYWFGMSLKDAPVNGWFVANTQGASGIGGPLADGQTLYHVIDSSNAVVVNYVDLAGTYGGDPSNHLDISYFVNEAPEPATAGLMAIAGIVLLGRRGRATRA
ncbi:MAG TPA: PEP-CTERM sorting domain-containing protein [Phycisphaerae bacterium]|nr:PEP-CTERM sorting domain-containing protein [Phycisphaerae bacterium]